ncbi:MAG: exodeoxyribonuclease III [Planctomycetota bacterium]|nr:exodeoxyribonuclease III [Planctomycetota bacterium]
MRFIVATYNANSVRSRIPLILEFLKEYSPDVLCLQETKVEDSKFPKLELEGRGYKVVFRGQKAYSGVATLSKVAPDDVTYGLDDGEPADEPRLIRAKYGEITIVNNYVPQGTSPDSENFKYKLRYLERMKNYFERHFTPEDNVLWCGDLNVAPEDKDVHDPKGLLGHVDFHPEVHKRFFEIMKWGFVDVFRKFHPEPKQFTFYDYRVPNAVKRGLGWRVDHILATRPLAEKSTDSFIVLDYRMKEKPSDHTFLVATFEL